jgi:WD40 repeat protein
MSGSTSFKILGEDKHGNWFAIVNTKILNQFNIALERVIVQFEAPCEIAFSADGEYLASGGRISAVIYDIGTGQKIGPFVENKGIFSDEYLNSTPPLRRNFMRGSRCVSVNGNCLATGGDDGIIKLWDVKREEATGELQGHAASIVKIEVSADGKNLLSSSQDCKVIYWDLERQIKLFELSINQGAPKSLAVSPNGNLLAAAGFGTYDTETAREVLVWNTNGKVVAILETVRASEFVEFSPDGSQLFAGSSYTGASDLWEFDRQVKENGGWRSKSPKLGSWGGWHALSWHSDGPWALSEGNYGCKVFNVMSGQPLFHLEVPSEPMSMSFFGILIEKSLYHYNPVSEPFINNFYQLNLGMLGMPNGWGCLASPNGC